MKSVKRLAIILLIIAACVLPVSAKGRPETTEPLQVSSFVRNVSTLFDFATTEICIAVHPFPSVLRAFTEYDTERTSWNSGKATYGVLINKPISEVSESSFLLSSPKEQRDTFKLSDLSNMFSRKEENGKNVIAQRDLDDEEKSWGIISYLFLIFTVLEILYVTIRGYLVDEENLIRKIVTRLLVTAILFLVLMSLPALVELFRIGFFQLAETITTPFAFTDVMDARSVFELPGGVLRCTSKLLRNMSPLTMSWNLDESLGGGGLNGFPANFGSWFMKIMMRILYFLLNIFVMILSLISAFSVMANIVEVYLLLAIVMCLVPFQVFSGTRFLVGENLIKSLFANVVELFVIMVIIGTTANAAYVISQVGVAYMTNPDYYPVAVTIDTSKLAYGGKYVFKEGLPENQQGLLVEFYTSISDEELSDSEDKAMKAGEIIRSRFVKNYYDDHGNKQLLDLDSYRNPGEAAQSVSKVYLSGTAGYTGYSSGSPAPTVDEARVVFSIPGTAPLSANSSLDRRDGTASFAMSGVLGYLMKHRYLGLLDDTPASVPEGLSPEEQAAEAEKIQKTNETKQKTREFLKNVSETVPPEGRDEFWRNSVVLELDFDISEITSVERYQEGNVWFARIPINTVKLSFLGMLGTGVEEHYKGNKAIDTAMLSFLNACMTILGSSEKWENLSYIEKFEVLTEINAATGDAITVSYDAGFIEAAHLVVEGVTSPTWGLMIQHFFVSIMAALMQVYFIKKSSQITQALMSGGVSQDRMAGMQGRILSLARSGAMMPVRAVTGLLGGIAGGVTGGPAGAAAGLSQGPSSGGGGDGGSAPINSVR